MMNLTLLLIFSVSFAFANSREELQDYLNKFEAYQDTTVRLDLYSRSFLGVPYGHGGPLGEGPQGRYDQDPLYRFDAFDCTTYVETMMSLALSKDADEFEKTMDEIRYENGIVDYLKRNHYPSLQWIPNNISNGILKEINHLVLPESEIKTAEAVINLPGWLKKIKLEEIRIPFATHEERLSRLEELQSLASQFSPMVATLRYLPINTLVKRPHLLKLIPSGTLVNFVRPNWDLTELAGTHMNVSHQGFIFKKDGKTVLRHASTSGKVVEVDLLAYLKNYVNHATMKGIHLMQINL